MAGDEGIFNFTHYAADHKTAEKLNRLHRIFKETTRVDAKGKDCLLGIFHLEALWFC